MKLNFLEFLSCSDGTVGGRDMKGVGVKTPRRPPCPFSGFTPEHGVETQTLCDGRNLKPNIFENLFSLCVQVHCCMHWDLARNVSKIENSHFISEIALSFLSIQL